MPFRTTMTEAPTLPAFTCTETACQISAGGTCIEGFPEPEVCPHATRDLSAVPADNLDDDAADEPADEAADESLEDAAEGEPELVAVPGDEALTLQEAGDLMARHPVNVVLVAGEAEVGKTTLVAELFARFLFGRFGPWSFGGSETLRAFHIRLHPSFAESGAGTSTTERTADEEMRFLHLDLSRDGEGHNIIASDGKGEYFENLIDGSPVAQEVPIAGRVNRCLIAIDGSRLNDPTLRDSTMSHARLLLRALRGPEGIPPECPVALVCTKWDCVDGQSREAVLTRLNALATAQDGNVVVLTASVRPGPPAADVDGLLELLEFIASAPHTDAAPITASGPGSTPPPSVGRHFWRAPDGVRTDADD
jgi:hypothetical protein